MMWKALLTLPMALLGGRCLASAACGEEGACDAQGDLSAMVQMRRTAAAGRQTLALSPPQLPMCKVNATVHCLGGTDGNMCAGDQCCPGAGGSPTYPCPSATSGWGEGKRGTGSTKMLDCVMPTLRGTKPTKPHQKGLNSVPYMGTFHASGAGTATEPSGKIKINVTGTIKEYWLPGATTEGDFTSVKYLPPYRFYLMDKYTTNYSNPDDFVYLPYIGKTFSVDFYFGEDGPGCGCNLDFYLVKMPAAKPWKDGDYYCDAQCFPDMGCFPEFDMNEGNTMTQQITNHACTSNYADHPDWQCNKWGDPEGKTTSFEFSPGTGHIIESTKNFSRMALSSIQIRTITCSAAISATSIQMSTITCSVAVSACDKNSEWLQALEALIFG